MRDSALVDGEQKMQSRQLTSVLTAAPRMIQPYLTLVLNLTQNIGIFNDIQLFPMILIIACGPIEQIQYYIRAGRGCSTSKTPRYVVFVPSFWNLFKWPRCLTFIDGLTCVHVCVCVQVCVFCWYHAEMWHALRLKLLSCIAKSYHFGCSRMELHYLYYQSLSYLLCFAEVTPTEPW